ncbi:GNAT family N-acetyltransferase [Falsigemmobacter faecalis]|uniref:GNAT family N-acetyltransferase n=1 Tax=Falsigemmobacter faecalis TaxID=2488730 RepID=A0A3P3DVZ3_9RHOB|nr:GNAT family N-acetyltransferase [Falsigemmobacter faecalis]RRH78420.1 GNAT family N-acetyltransferase [Falsigemmobacter faecalis]
MNTPQLQDWFDALDATWPGRAVHALGPWRIREGAGGGQRVSAATTAVGDVSDAEIAEAEEFHRSLGQKPLFQIRPGQAALDARLAARGYRMNDATELRAAPVTQFTPPPRLRSIMHWPPLALTREIWQGDHIGPERVAVMERVEGQKTALIGRDGNDADRASGAAFVACSGRIAMLHALVVLPNMRRRGSANYMMCGAAEWAQDHGADWLAVAVTQANAGAAALYTSLEMPVVGDYHYRSL